MSHPVLLVLPALLFVAELLAIHVGYRYRRAPHDREANAAVAPVVSTVLSLMGLVLAFSFSNAAGRLDGNRKAILDEANAIETAWLRMDLALPEARPELGSLLKQYVDARVSAYHTFEELKDEARYRAEVEESAVIFRRLWAAALAGTPPTPDRMLVLNALTSMRDTATARSLSMNTHLPPAIYMFLFGVVLIGGLLVGGVLAQAERPHWLYRVAMAAVFSWTIFSIMDMEYPRLGAFQLLQSADALLVELRKSMR
jgi:hypothetical protein